MIFDSGSQWKFIKSELEKTRQQLELSKDTLAKTKANLKLSMEDLNKMNLQKNIIKGERDSLLLHFKRKNAKDWESLQGIKDSISDITIELNTNRSLLDSLFGL